MKIANSDIMLKSESYAAQSLQRSETMNYWKSEVPNAEGEINDIVEISKDALNACKDLAPCKKSDNEEVLFEMSEQDKNKLILLEAFMEKVTGKKMKFMYFEKAVVRKLDTKQISAPGNIDISNGRVGWGFEYSYHEMYTEQESMSFSAKGVVNTEDGQQIKLDLELNLSRMFVEENNLQIKAGDALTDPIVINFDGPAASLTQEKYVFDIDSDGKDDEISFVSQGSGLLALDLNGDGVINNGTELFGPNTQDGFSELAAYDFDENGWIDENDAIYDKLRIWTKDENGNDQLFALGQKDVGAIYLGNIDTDYSYKDADNNLLGRMRASSIYLADSGNVGTVHQIDLAK